MLQIFANSLRYKVSYRSGIVTSSNEVNLSAVSKVSSFSESFVNTNRSEKLLYTRAIVPYE